MKRRDEVLVGIFTTAAVVILVIGGLWFVRGGLQAGYPLFSRFAWGAGLKQGQPVWLAGVTVGFVDDVILDPRGSLVVKYRIRKEYKVPKGTTATVVPNGFFGDQAVALTPSIPNDASFASGDTVPVGQAAASIAALTQRADTMTIQLNKVLESLHREMVDSGGLRELRRMFAQSSRLSASLNEIAAVQSRELSTTLASFRRSANAIDSLQVDSAVHNINVTSGNVAVVTADLKATTARLNTILTKIESGDGSVGKLLSDPALYNDIRTVLARVDSLTADLKKNPRKYIPPIRIF